VSLRDRLEKKRGEPSGAAGKEKNLEGKESV